MVDDEDVSCDKAAKDLSNLLKVLNLQEESKREESGDEAQSILRDIDESLAKLKLNCPKPMKQSLKSRGFGDEDCSGAYVWAGGRELDLQPAADLADFFSRQYSDMFMTQSPNMLQTSLNFDSRTNSSWGQANTPHDLTNSNYQNEIFGGVNSDRLSDIVSGPPSQNYQFTVDRDGASSRTMMVNIPNSKDLGFTFTNLGYSYEIPVPDSSETVKAKRIKYSEWNQRGNVFGSPTSDTSVTLPSECARTQDSVPQRAADQLYTTANLDQTTCASIYAPAASSHVYRNVTSRSSASSSAMSTGIPSPSSAYSSDMTASSPGSVFSPQSQRSNSPPDVGHIYCPPSWSDSGISSSQYSPYSSQQSSDSPGSPSSQAVTDFSAESSVNSQQSRQSLYTSVGTRDQDFISGRPMRPANSDRPEQTFLGRLPIPARTLPSVGQQPRVDSPYERSFHFKNEEGDGLLHILVYMYECQLMSANPETAPKFLQYISRRFLSHPSIATCLNHQNNQLQTPLYLAVKKSLTGMVDLLMKYGADVNIQGRWQAEWEKIPQLDAPLHAAVAMGDRGLNLVNTLLTSNAADINILNTEGETPLHVASREHGTPDLNNNSRGVKSCMKMVQLLLQRDADMMAKDYKSGKTPIMLAIEGRDVGLVRMMLDISGPRICHSLLNECTHGLNTCMHLAFGLKHMEPSKHVELIRLLVRSGGEAETENSANHKAKDMAPHIYTKAVEIWR